LETKEEVYMETAYVREDELQVEAISVEEKEEIFSPVEAGDEEVSVEISDEKALSDRDINVLSSYLKEMRGSVLISAQEELFMGKEVMDEEEKKRSLTQSWIVMFSKMAKKNKPAQKSIGKDDPADQYCDEIDRIEEQFSKIVSLDREHKKLERMVRSSAPGSYERKKLCRMKVENLNTAAETLLRINLLSLNEKGILKKLEKRFSIDKAKKKSTAKEMQVILQGLRAAEARSRDAKEKLVRANLRLVVGIAKKYINRGLPLADLIQEGNIGLMRAVEKFDYRLGNRLSTYACWWIRQTMLRSIDEQTRTIRVPVYVNERIKKMIRSSQQLAQNMGSEPVSMELAEKMGLPYSQVDEIMQVAKDTISLESPLGEDESSLKDYVPNNLAPSPLDDVLHFQLFEEADEALRFLSPREETIIRMRYGLGVDTEHTLAEIGEKLGVSRERIRQIEVTALRKLRRSEKLRELKLFLKQ